MMSVSMHSTPYCWHFAIAQKHCSVDSFTLVKSKQIQIMAVFVSSTLYNTIGKLNRCSLINTFCGQLWALAIDI